MSTTPAPVGDDDAASLRTLARRPLMRAILVRQAQRGLVVQHVLRGALILYLALALVAFPPGNRTGVCAWVVAGYVVYAAVVYVVSRRTSVLLVRWMWLAFVVDTAVLALLTGLAAAGDRPDWAATVLSDGFFVLPLMAATQLRPWVAAVVTVPSVTAMLVAGWLAQPETTEPWGLTTLRAVMLLAIGVCAYLLSRVQRYRVVAIGGLADQRSRLLHEVSVIEEREREDLAVDLHDGALQYVLAAAQDLEALTTGPTEDLPELDEEELLARVSIAVAESAVLLRSSVSELHPRALAELGLGRALEDLTTTMAARGRFAVDLDTTGWPAGRTPVDLLLFVTARELLTNVVRHAHASRVRVSLRLLAPPPGAIEAVAELTVQDDGVGLARPAAGSGRVSDGARRGHIGLSARRTRLEAASGHLSVTSSPGCGVLAVASVPVPEDLGG